MEYAGHVDGFLFLDKPAGVTSHDVVDTIRRRLGARRVGHAGTLDPAATGLLILGVGRATRELRRLLALPKTYEAEVTLGATSSTDDREGTIVRAPPSAPRVPTKNTVERALQHLTGGLEQTPPLYSAVKIRGVPAHRRARRGERIELRPRHVTVYSAELLDYHYPILRVRWKVSSGTYIRALARDLGTVLGAGAYLSALQRTAVGPFHITEALPLSETDPAALRLPENIFERIRTADAAHLV